MQELKPWTAAAKPMLNGIGPLSRKIGEAYLQLSSLLEACATLRAGYSALLQGYKAANCQSSWMHKFSSEAPVATKELQEHAEALRPLST